MAGRIKKPKRPQARARVHPASPDLTVAVMAMERFYATLIHRHLQK
jgi:hypothetical protein